MAASKAKKSNDDPVLARNRKARHEFQIIEEIEAGLELVGSEVKSLRNRHVTFQDAFAEFRGDQLYLKGVSIAEYAEANQFNHVPGRARRLLLQRGELDRWRGKVEQQGLTIVPLDIHVKGRWIKCNLALVKGMKDYDKRHALREKQVKRETERVVKHGQYD